MAQRRLVLGLGNPLAGEDGFGVAVVEALRRQPDMAGGADVRDAGTDLLGELDTFAGYDEVVLVDVLVGAGHAGQVSVVEEPVFTNWPEDSPGGHALSPLLAVKLFRRLHPEAATRFTLVALHADELRVGQGVGASAVEAGVAALVDLLRHQEAQGQSPAAHAPAVAAPPFQVCGSCRTPWASWQAFVLDARVRLLGLQAVPSLPDASLLVFEHGCGSSVSILTKRLRHLLPDDPARAGLPSLRGTEQCPGHCRSLEDLAACDRPCSNARDRDLIKLVRRLRASRAT